MLYLAYFTNVLIYISLAPLFAGLLSWMRARLLDLPHRSPFLPYLELKTRFKQRANRPEHASSFFNLAPRLSLASYITLGFLIPVAYLIPSNVESTSFFQLSANVFLIFYLLGFSKFVMGLTAIDAASTFTGMSASRTLYLHTLVEPVAIFCLLGFAVYWGTPDIAIGLLEQQANGIGVPNNLGVWLLLGAWSIVSIAEVPTYPFDQYQNHLELIRVEEPQYIEHSGEDLAYIRWGEMLKLTFFVTLLVHLIWPGSLALPGGSFISVVSSFFLYLAKMGIALVGVSIWEVTRAQIDMDALQRPLQFAFLLVVVALTFILI